MPAKKSWEKREFLPEDPCCVRCCTMLSLGDAEEWPARSFLCLCHTCALEVIQSLLQKQERLLKQLAKANKSSDEQMEVKYSVLKHVSIPCKLVHKDYGPKESIYKVKPHLQPWLEIVLPDDLAKKGRLRVIDIFEDSDCRTVGLPREAVNGAWRISVARGSCRKV